MVANGLINHHEVYFYVIIHHRDLMLYFSFGLRMEKSGTNRIRRPLEESLHITIWFDILLLLLLFTFLKRIHE